MADIIDELRAAAVDHDSTGYVMEKAAAEIAALRAALKPFADYADSQIKLLPDFVITHGSPMARKQLRMGDCYEAARALERRGDNG